MNRRQASTYRFIEISFPQTASLPMKGETGKVTHGVTSVSCCNTLDQRRFELSENSSNKKIIGVPIFDMPRSSLKKELSSITSPSVSIPTMSDAKAMESENNILPKQQPTAVKC